MKILKIVILTFTLSITLCVSISNAQNPKAKLAEGYLKSADYENASRLYFELYQSDKKNINYFDGLVKSYKAQNKFKDLLEIAKSRASEYPSDQSLNLLAEMYWRTGNPIEANNNWNKAINEYFVSIQTFQLVSATQSELQLFDKAINTLITGRNTLKDKRAFSDLLIKMYIATGNYREGMNEVLNELALTNNIQYAQGRIYALMSSPEANQYIETTIKSYADSQTKNIISQELYAWLLRNLNKSNEALEIYIRIDKLRNSRGLDIFTFAETSRKDADYAIALKAYEVIIDEGKTNPYISNALFGYAQTLEAKFGDVNKIPALQVEEIIQRYQKIINEFPNSSTSADSKYRIAKLYYYQLNKNNKALEEINSLVKQFPNLPLCSDALILAGNIYLSMNDVEKASESFKFSLDKASKTFPDNLDPAKMKLAEIEYYKGNIDTALVLFQLISKNSNSKTANDALDRIMDIEKNKKFKDLLVSFAAAEFALLRKDSITALNHYYTILKEEKETELTERAYIEAAKLELARNNPTSAKKLLIQLNEKFIYSNYGDLAIFTLANIYTMENNKNEAIAAYTQILVKYPTSIYLQDARNNIRKLRDGL